MNCPPRARLLLDTGCAAAGLGLRGSGAALRQLVYRRGAHQLDVTAPEPDGEARFVWGQLLRGADPCVDATVAWVTDDGAVLARASTDEFGEFRLAARPGGAGALLVGAADAAFVCDLPPEGAAR